MNNIYRHRNNRLTSNKPSAINLRLSVSSNTGKSSVLLRRKTGKLKGSLIGVLTVANASIPKVQILQVGRQRSLFHAVRDVGDNSGTSVVKPLILNLH
jgi:hypothetical protein